MSRERAGTDIGLGCLLLLLAWIPLGLLNAFTIQSLWTWFVTPTFSIAVPSMLMCWGLDVLITYVWALGAGNYGAEKRMREADTFTEGVITTLCIPVAGAGIALLTGYILHLYV